MKLAVVLLSLFFVFNVGADEIPNEKQECNHYRTCSEVSLTQKGYVLPACKKVQNCAQDMCAVLTIQNTGDVLPDCLTLIAGGNCAVQSLTQKGYIVKECQAVKNSRQDACATNSLKNKGYVITDCLELP